VEVCALWVLLVIIISIDYCLLIAVLCAGLLLYWLQWGIAVLQRADGLHHGGSADVELWCRWNDLYPLERSAAPPTSLSHNDQCTHGSCLHQVFTGLDHVGRTGHHLALGSALFTFLFCFLVLLGLHLRCESLLFWSSCLSSVDCLSSVPCLSKTKRDRHKISSPLWETGVAEQEYDIRFCTGSR